MTPRDSILPPTYLLVRLNQRFAIDPRLPSLCHFAMQRVTSLEPRTPHQPGKLQKLSKNEFVFTPFIFRVNKKPVLLSSAKSMECRPSTCGCSVNCATPSRDHRRFFERLGVLGLFFPAPGQTAAKTPISQLLKSRQESCWERRPSRLFFASSALFAVQAIVICPPRRRDRVECPFQQEESLKPGRNWNSLTEALLRTLNREPRTGVTIRDAVA